jgi:dTDP-4-amino-4,6-dideoxygalactose transaminase
MRRVVERTDFVAGVEVCAFEESFAAYLGCASAVGVASGTAALHLALAACGVGMGDEVIVPALTFAATAEAVCHSFARLVFVDVDERTCLIDPGCVEQALTPRTKAIVPVHLYGQPADMDALLDVAEGRGIQLIEDAAQAHGAMYKGRHCGTIGYAGCFSFFPGKNLGAYGDGGAVVSNDQRLIDRVRLLRDHGRHGKYQHSEIGFCERLDTLQAAVLGVKLSRLDSWNERRRMHADAYRALLPEALSMPFEKADVKHVYHQFVIRTSKRDALRLYLNEKGVSTGIHYPIPLHRQPAFREFGQGTSLPVSEGVTGEILSLPMYPELTTCEISHVADLVRSFFEGHREVASSRGPA